MGGFASQYYPVELDEDLDWGGGGEDLEFSNQ